MLPTQAQGMGGKANMQLTIMKEFKLGPTDSGMFPLIFSMMNSMSLPILTWADLSAMIFYGGLTLLLNYEKKDILPDSQFTLSGSF